jgi:DNA modification methylase
VSIQDVLTGRLPWWVETGDALVSLRQLPDCCVQTCATSPPYYSLRDYGTGRWEGGSAGCDHKPSGGKQGVTGQRADRTFTAEQVFRDVCGKCSARRVDLQIGLEQSPAAFIARLVAVFAEVRRVLRPDGTCWVNMGDSYNNFRSQMGPGQAVHGRDNFRGKPDVKSRKRGTKGIKEKDLLGIPWQLALALREDGWYLRSEIVWVKQSPMPESCRDRPTKAHEQIFLLTRSPTYFYDQDAERVPQTSYPHSSVSKNGYETGPMDRKGSGWKSEKVTSQVYDYNPNGRNLWTYWPDLKETPEEALQAILAHLDDLGMLEQVVSDVWGDLKPSPFAGRHFATFPLDLPRRCIALGTSAHGACAKCGAPWRRVTERTQKKRERPNEYVKRSGESGTGNSCANTVAGVSTRTLGWEKSCLCETTETQPCLVLDPFSGTATTGLAARRMGRRYLGLELSPEYAELSRERLRTDNPLLDAAEAVPVAASAGLFDALDAEAS